MSVRILFFGLWTWNDSCDDLSEIIYRCRSFLCRHNSRIHHQQVTEGFYEGYYDRQTEILGRIAQALFRNKKGK